MLNGAMDSFGKAHRSRKKLLCRAVSGRKAMLPPRFKRGIRLTVNMPGTILIIFYY